MHQCSTTTFRFQLVSLVVALAFFAAAGGCLVTSSSKTQDSGTRVSQVTLNQIKPGETTEAWLIAAAGEPTSRRVADGQLSILRYDHVTTRSSSGTIFLIFAGGNTKSTQSSVIFEVRDGVIDRYWTESDH